MEQEKTVDEVIAVQPVETAQWYRSVSYKDAKIFIRTNLTSAARSFIAVGYYLKHIRDTVGYTEDGFADIWEFAQAEYGISKSTASRYMTMNDRFSQGGNSPMIRDEYKEFGKSQLQEMLALSDEQLEQVRPTDRVEDIRNMRKPREIPYIEIPGQVELTDFPGVDPSDVQAAAEAREQLTARSQEREVYTVSAADLLGEDTAGSAQSVAISQQLAADQEQAEPKTGRCYHRPEFECTLKEAHKLIAGDGEDCAQKCCWNCGHHGDCNLECYSSAKRPEPKLEQPEGPLSAYGTPREVYPEDILITTPGCEGGHSCFSCHLNCAIRQQDCYCVEAPMGNPFPCEMVPKIPELREKIGAGCQMVNHDLAYHRVGDHEPVPCCKECIAPCEYMCSRARNARGSAAAADPVENPQDEVRPWEEEKIDESYNIGDLPQAKESLLRQLAKVLVERCGGWMVLDGVTHIGRGTKERLRDIDRQDDGIALQDGVQAYPSEEIIEFFRGEEDLGVCTYARFETQARKALDDWVQAGKPQAKPEPEPEPEPPKEVIDAEFSEIPAGQAEDVYDSVILAEMIRKAEKELTMMEDCWKEKQPETYKRKRMALEAYKMYQAAHD